MFDFFYQEEFWMEVIIAAAVTGAFAVIAACITYNYHEKQIMDEIKRIGKHKGLSQEHKGLSQEHEIMRKDLVEKTNWLNTSVNENKEITRTVEKMLVEDKAKSECQYNTLTEKQKCIIDSVSNLQSFAKEMKILQEERNSILEENKNLRAENSNLKAECLNYVQVIANLTEKKVPHKDRGIER